MGIYAHVEPKDRFSRNEAHITFTCCLYLTQMGPICYPNGLSHMGSWTTVVNTLSVPFALPLWDTYYIPYYCKNACRTLLTAMFNWRKPMYYQGYSRAIVTRLLGFTYVHAFWDVTRNDFIHSNVHRSDVRRF